LGYIRSTPAFINTAKLNSDYDVTVIIIIIIIILLIIIIIIIITNIRGGLALQTGCG